MQPLSHDALVQMLKHRINQSGYSLPALCARASINEDEMTKVLTKRAYASCEFLGRLGFVFGIDFRSVSMSYALWRFEAETLRIARKSRPEAKPVNIFHKLKIAEDMIRSNPHTEAAVLVEEIHATLLLDRGAIRNQIASLRGRATGDYASYG